jgi:chromosome segregation ATPase
MNTAESTMTDELNECYETRDDQDIDWPTIEQLQKLDGDALGNVWTKHRNHVKSLHSKINKINQSNDQLVNDQQDLKQQLFDAARRENVLVMRLASKQHEIHELEVPN